MPINPGRDAIIMPRILMRRHGDELPDAPLRFAVAFPMTGRYVSRQCLLREVTKVTARVRLVVPVVPEAAMTCAPLVCMMAMEVPPVPVTGNRNLAAPQWRAGCALGVGTHNDDAVNLAEFNLLGNLPVQPFSRLIDLLKSALGNDDRLP